MDGVRRAFRFSKWKPTSEQWTLAAQCVQPEEKERIGRFVFQKDAKSAMCGRLLLRKIIAESLHIPYKNIRLTRTEKAKPILDNDSKRYSNFNFNVSHQGEYAVIAAESDHQVGVDVMQIEYPRNRGTEKFFSMFERQFTSQEWKTIRTPTSEWQQLTNFYRLWCLKESYVKALGVGIGFTLHRLDFLINSEVPVGQTVCDTTVRVDGALQQDWRFEEMKLDDNHCVAVALKRKDASQKWRVSGRPFKQLDFDELVAGAETQTMADTSYWDSFNAKLERPGNH